LFFPAGIRKNGHSFFREKAVESQHKNLPVWVCGYAPRTILLAVVLPVGQHFCGFKMMRIISRCKALVYNTANFRRAYALDFGIFRI
jgi:hypothetical protein